MTVSLYSTSGGNYVTRATSEADDVELWWGRAKGSRCNSVIPLEIRGSNWFVCIYVL